MDTSTGDVSECTPKYAVVSPALYAAPAAVRLAPAAARDADDGVGRGAFARLPPIRVAGSAARWCTPCVNDQRGFMPLRATRTREPPVWYRAAAAPGRVEFAAAVRR